MGKCRFLYQNLITAESMISVSSLKLGVVTTALKAGTGSAVITPSGDYTGAVDLEYVIEIDSLGTGEIGSSHFKWSDDGGATWDATGVDTAATDISLNNGVNIKWTAGGGADFVLGDKWYFKGINLHNPGKMLDFDRDSRYRSADSDAENTITIDLGSAQEVKALILYDHNLTGTATIILDGDAAATFDSGGGGAPQFHEHVTWADDKILHYLSTATTKRYWRLKIQDADNADDYNEIGELFLGSYLDLSHNYSEGFQQDISFLLDSNKTSYGIERDRFYGQRSAWQYDFNMMSATDVTNLKALVSSIASAATGILKALWINPDYAVLTDFSMVKITGLPVKHRTLGYYDMPLKLMEVLKSL